MRYLVILGLLVFTGCASVKYTSTDPVTKKVEEFSYHRLGTQKISGFEASKNTDGVLEVKLNASEGGSGDLAEALKNLSLVATKVIP